MRRIVPRESRDLNESWNKILRFAQDDLLSHVRFLLAVEMTEPPAGQRAGSTNASFYEFVIFRYSDFRFEDLGADGMSIAGGKNAFLGEIIRALKGKGIQVPGGFATTSDAYCNYRMLSFPRLMMQAQRNLEQRGLPVASVR